MERTDLKQNDLITLGSAQYGGRPKDLQQRRHNLGGMRIPYAGSKIIFFLFLNSSFCAAGDYGTS